MACGIVVVGINIACARSTYKRAMVMLIRWVLVATTVSARVYQLSGKALRLIDTLEHPDGLKKSCDLSADRPGRYGASYTGQVSSFDPPHTPKEIETDKFACQLIQYLEKARNANHYQALTLIMPAHFWGLLHKHLSKPLLLLIDKIIQKNVLNLTKNSLEKYIIALHFP